jgi:hypothetical protein
MPKKLGGMPQSDAQSPPGFPRAKTPSPLPGRLAFLYSMYIIDIWLEPSRRKRSLDVEDVH